MLGNNPFITGQFAQIHVSSMTNQKNSGQLLRNPPKSRYTRQPSKFEVPKNVPMLASIREPRTIPYSAPAIAEIICRDIPGCSSVWLER
jgi:hypothetical protein